MTNDREQTACCGLCCGDCIPSNRPLFDAAEKLKQELEKCQFGAYAKYKSKSNRAFADFGIFQEVLDALLTLPCSKPCSQGGGRPDCPIRACACGKGMDGCWKCTASETCTLLEPLSAAHGDTVKHNLRAIKQHGVENWTHVRGKHYVWAETEDPRPSHNRHRAWNGQCHRVDFEAVPWQAPAPGVRFKTCERDGSRLRLAEFTKEFVEADWCVKGHVGYVLEGVIAVDFRQREEVFVAGDGLFIPPGNEHGHKARAVTNSVTLILVDEDGI
jgi:mannose-6-phosphate isomerase-like protein (cupin superfamily)